MRIKPSNRRTLTLLLLASLSSGCTTFKPVAYGDIRAGDVVRIRSVTGELEELHVQRIEGSSIVTSERTLSRADAAHVERRTTSFLRTLGLTVAGVAAATVVSGQDSQF